MLLSKRKRTQVELMLGSIVNNQDSDMVVVRAAECQVLLMNTAAQKHLDPNMPNNSNCKTGYSRCFPGLCAKCPGMEEPQQVDRFAQFDIQNEDGRVFNANCTTVDWIDGKPATVWLLRDMDEARSAEHRLYNLAYIDQLTGIPNRQRFREDFEALKEKLASGKLRGMVAIFDLDNFKAVNDTYGHNTGDIMLRRIAEHIGSNQNYKGHLYRLGGDEFVLFYADLSDANTTLEDYHSYYDRLLQEVLCSYTLPNIELACTISMGAALLPQHGTTVSELLRKADIALYKAKAAGRNCLMFFEDRFDTVKKLKDIYINIQPILMQNGRTFGYELLDQGDKEEAKGEVRLSEFDRTLDALGLEDLENDAKYFVAYSNQLNNEAVLNNLPKDKFIIQIPLPPICSEADLRGYAKLRASGYTLAVTGLRGSNLSQTLLTLADYFKFEPGNLSDQMQDKIIAQNPKKLFIAMGVDIPAAYTAARLRGFKLFQGYYFNKPAVTKKTKEIDPLKINYLRLLKLTSTDGFVDFQEISGIISSDVALSYKLLRLLNSSAVGLRYKISSIGMAVAYLGEENLKKWIALLALRGAVSDRPLELLRLSLVRAQFGELLCTHMKPKRDPRQVFLVGMFSLLHIALDKTKAELMEEIPVSEDISESLMTEIGRHSDLLAFYSDYEYANWDEVNTFAEHNDLSCQTINDCYIEAVKWYNSLIKE